MKVRIMNVHPISNPRGPECWDGKEYDLDTRLDDVAAVGKWLTRRTGITYDYRPGKSRLVEGRPCFFPRRYTTRVHCQWVEKVTT